MRLLSLLSLTLLVAFGESTWLESLLDKSYWKSLTAVRQLCDVAPTSKTRRFCLNSPKAFQLVGLALNDAVSECHKQFAHDKWDCGARLGSEDVYLQLKGKESALFHALLSTSAAQTLAKACSKGHLDDCSCGKLPTKKNESFIWAGCSDNVQFANKVVRQIFDSIESKRNASSLMNVHNNRAGRKLLLKKVEQKCKCHGVSGSCVTKTCWNVVPEIPTLVSALHNKYSAAIQVELSSNSTSLVLSNQTLSGRQQRSLQIKDQKPAPNDLVFIEEAPDTCKLKHANGALLSVGRECSNKEECDRLCCGRGFISVREVHMTRCNCSFHYCCEVKCDQCAQNVERFFCK